MRDWMRAVAYNGLCMPGGRSFISFRNVIAFRRFVPPSLPPAIVAGLVARLLGAAPNGRASVPVRLAGGRRTGLSNLSLANKQRVLQALSALDAFAAK